MSGLLQWLTLTVGGGGLIGMVMWSVGVAALIALAVLRLPYQTLGWRWGAARYHLIALGLPILYGGLAYGLAGQLGLVDFATHDNLQGFVLLAGYEDVPLAQALALALPIALLGGLPGSVALGVGEEIGWRGFLTPRMTLAFGFLGGTLLTGGAWALWHLPLILWGGYSGEGERAFELASFLIMVLGLSGVMVWLRMASGSFWPAAVLHGAHNLIIQNIFDRLVTPGPSPITMVSEFGVVLAAVVLLISLPFWGLGHRLWRRSRQDAPSAAHLADATSVEPIGGVV